MPVAQYLWVLHSIYECCPVFIWVLHSNIPLDANRTRTEWCLITIFILIPHSAEASVQTILLKSAFASFSLLSPSLSSFLLLSPSLFSSLFLAPSLFSSLLLSSPFLLCPPLLLPCVVLCCVALLCCEWQGVEDAGVYWPVAVDTWAAGACLRVADTRQGAVTPRLFIRRTLQTCHTLW